MSTWGSGRLQDSLHMLNIDRMLGQAQLKFFGMSIYTARLWVGSGFSPDQCATEPLILDIEYARKLEGALIAERSMIEMRRIGAFDQQSVGWFEFMTRCFPNVAAGDRLTGVYDGVSQLSFYFNHEFVGMLDDALFAHLFIGIWLHPNTSAPALRAQLLGQV